MNDYEKLIERGEIAAERGEHAEALASLEQALIAAIDSKNYGDAINVLGHHLHIYKALYQKSGNAAYMELFYMDTQTGLRLAETYGQEGQPKSVMQLRAGDYFLFKQQYELAADWYKQACEELNRTGQQAPETNGEYLGHYAAALVKAGKKDEGIAALHEALGTMEQHTLRQFHHDIIHSGILLRLADAYHFMGEADQAQAMLDQAKPLVDQLEQEHQMPDRKKQWEQLEAKLKNSQ